MAETLKPIADLVDERPNVDNSAVFERGWALLTELKAKVAARFDLTLDPSCEPVREYGGIDGGPAGHLHAYNGPEVDWMVHSWLGKPTETFSNMHLTVWLGPHTKVPHLGMAWGTVPDLWFYLDYLPRADLLVDLDHLDRYFEPVNEPWLALRERIEIPAFVSRSLYIRESLSDVAHCYHGPAESSMDLLEPLAREHLDRWLAWVDAGDPADPVPADERAALAERDLAIRRNVAQRDPANVLGVRFFGEELTNTLVRTLWGGDRVNPRPGLEG